MASTTTQHKAPVGKIGGLDIAGAFKESFLAAVVAGVLALPLVGLKTVTEGTEIGLETRFDWVVIGVAAVFFGRLAMAVARQARGASPKSEQRNLGKVLNPYMKWIGLAGIAFAILLPQLPFSNRTVVDLATLVLIYVMLGWGLNIVVGLAGLLDLGYVAFYAVGAYSYALLNAHFGWSFWACLPLAGVFAASFGIMLGYPVLRLRGDYLAIVTLGFGEIIRVVLLNWFEFTGGPDGIIGIPRPSFFGFPFTRRPDEGEVAFHQLFDISYSSEHRLIFLYYLILGLALITNFVVLRLRRLPIGGRGKRCARTRSPAALLVSTRPMSSCRRSPSVPPSAVSPARSSPRARASSARSPLSSRNPPSSSPSWCWVAWAARSAWCWRL